MALGGVGYFATGYFHTNYWHTDYWTEQVSAVASAIAYKILARRSGFYGGRFR